MSKRSCEAAGNSEAAILRMARVNGIVSTTFTRSILQTDFLERENHKSEPIHPISPSTQLTKIPYKITGPAIVKILQPIPNTCPSF